MSVSKKACNSYTGCDQIQAGQNKINGEQGSSCATAHTLLVTSSPNPYWAPPKPVKAKEQERPEVPYVRRRKK